MVKMGIVRRLTAIVANMSLLLNSFLPILLATQPVYAQSPEGNVPAIVEVVNPEPTQAPEIAPVNNESPTPEPTNAPEPTSTPELIPTPSEEPTPTPFEEPTPTPQPENNEPVEISPTPSVQLDPSPTPVNSEIGSLNPVVENTPTPQITPEVKQVCLENNQTIVDSTNDLWTINDTDKISETTQKVQLGVKYIFPSDNKVSVTFKCLPKDESLRTTLKIQQVKTSVLNLPDNMGNIGEYAYDITTEITNGTFEYEVTLPKPENSTAEISYIEKSIEDATENEIKVDEIKPIEESKTEQSNDTVKATSVDHFTIFLVVNPDETLDENNVLNPNNGWVSDNLYAEFDNRNDSAEYGFPNTGVPASATIEGIEVYIEGLTSGRDFDISLWNQSNGSDEYTSSKTADLNSNETTVTLGSSTEKWGKTWTPADFDTNFKVVVDANSYLLGGTAKLDMIQVKVHYSIPVTPPTLPNNTSDTYALNSVTGNWTAISGGSGYQGIGTAEIRWGTPAGDQKSGLRFTNSGAQSFNSGNTFYLGMLTHMNWGTNSGTAADGATLQITLNFNRPNIPNPVFTYDFDIEETSNTSGSCRPYQISGTPCDDKITFPTSYGTQIVTIGDIQYTLVIDGFVNAYPSGSAVPAFITEEQRENSAFLVGHLSSVLVERPAISITKKTNDQDITSAPGENLNVGDIVTWQYIVQNIGNVDLTNVTVTDNPAATIDCGGQTTLASGLTMTCTASGTVLTGQFTNTATVVGTPPTGGNVTDSDTSWYNGVSPTGSIKIIKEANPESDQIFTFTSLNNSLGGFTLDDDGDNGNTYKNEIVFENLLQGTHQITETLVDGWISPSITCSENDNQWSSNGSTAIVHVVPGEQVVCTFTNTQKGSISGYKWDDADGSAATFIDRVVVPNWSVELWKDGVQQGTTTTDSNGKYEFTNLLPGVYQVKETTTGDWFNVDEISLTVTLDAGENDSGNDFVNAQYATVTIYKNVDTNGDGIIDITNSSDWTWDITGKVNNQTGITVSVLRPGVYTISEDQQSGYHVTSLVCNNGINSTWDYGAVESQSITLSSGQDLVCTFTNTSDYGSLKIIKDTQPNNSQDFVFTLKDGQNNVKGSAILDDDSNSTRSNNKTFLSLNTGEYKVNEDSVSGWSLNNITCTNTTGNWEFKDGYLSVFVKPGEQPECTFVNTRDTGTLIAHKFEDNNNNQTQDSNEDSLKNWDMNLYRGSNCNGSVLEDLDTNNSGDANFSNLTTGDYSVKETLKSGWKNTTSLCQNITITKDTTSTVNFGNYRLGSITIKKHTNPNSVEVFNYKFNSNNETFYNGDTDYFNELQIGSYTITESEEEGWYLKDITCSGSGSVSPDIANRSVTISLKAGESNTCEFVNNKLGKIEGKKFNDQNGDNDDHNEPNLNGWKIFIDENNNGVYDSGEKFNTTHGQYWWFGWHDLGVYSLDNLIPGTYQVCEEMQTGWYPTTQTNCQTTTINEDGGDIDILNFANRKYGTVNVFKFHDYNGSGTIDGSDYGLSGWNIGLYNGGTCSGQVIQNGSMVTDDNGNANFTYLTPGTYSVKEEIDSNSTWVTTTPVCQTVVVTMGQTSNINIGNFQKGSVMGCKYDDLNGSGVRSGKNTWEGINEPQMSGWTIRLYNSGWEKIEETVTNPYFYFDNIMAPGTYYLCEQMKDGWYQTEPLNGPNYGYTAVTNQSGDETEGALCKQITVDQSGFYGSHYYSFGNRHLGTITVTKFNDLDGLGFKDDNEEVLEGWDINLTDQTPKTTDETGQVVFDKLVANTYYLSEDLDSQPGWTQTNIYCEGQTNSFCGNGIVESGEECDDENNQNRDGCSSTCQNEELINSINLLKVNPVFAEDDNLDKDNSYKIQLAAGQNLTCYIGNQRLEPKISIAKFNNVPVSGNLSPGDQVEYTINLNIQDNDVDDLKVTDLLSNGFKYRLGSYKVYLNGTEVVIPEPHYASPGVWDFSSLGTIKTSDTLRLVYTADISSDQQPGKYTDLAWAIADYNYDPSKSVYAKALLGEANGYVDTNFVGTIVPVAKNTQNSVSAEVEQKVEGQVLGASTELPGTGASAMWLILSSLLGFAGFSLLKINKKNMLTLLFALLSFGLIAKPVFAADFVLSIQELKSPTNTKDLKLEFKALHLNNGVITAKCLKKGPNDSGFSQFGSNIVLAAGGNSSYCDLSLAINDNGSYQFSVEATDGVNPTPITKTVSLDYNTSTPGNPRDYRKDIINSCDVKIHFKTDADSGKTVKVELYRSTDSAFSANNDSLVHSVNIGSDQEYDIYNSVPDCSKTYYYALRAFDNAGNGSGLVGDRITVTTTTTTTQTSVGTGTQSAIPVIASDIPAEGSDSITPAEGEIILDPSTTGQTGQVLGTEKGKLGNFISDHKIISSLIALAILGIIIYAIKKFKKNKKR